MDEQLANNTPLQTLDPEMCNKILMAKIDNLKQENMKMKLKEQYKKIFKEVKDVKDV